MSLDNDTAVVEQAAVLKGTEFSIPNATKRFQRNCSMDKYCCCGGDDDDVVDDGGSDILMLE